MRGWGGGEGWRKEREKERESVEQQSKHALIPIYNKNKKQTNFYFQIFAHEGFVTACPVGWIPTTYEEQASWTKIWSNSWYRARTCWTVVLRSLHRQLWHHTQFFMHGAVPRSHKESCFAVSLYFHVVFGRNPVGLRFAAKVYNVIGVNTLQHTPRVEPVVAILYRCFAVVPLQPRVVWGSKCRRCV